MKTRMIAILVVIGLALGMCVAAAATDQEKVILGEGACAKCVLKETKECQLTVTTDEGGKKVTYYLAPNGVTKHFGNQVCDARKKLKATGSVKSVDGKLELTPSRIELAKE
jgi:hypothetical protein